MQFKEVNLSDLPQCDVLCISDDGYIRIGRLILENEIVYCTGKDTTICDVTHYIPLDDIKPSEPKIKTYFMFAALRYCGGALNTGLSQRACNVERPVNESLDNVIDEWLTEIRNEVAELNNVDFKDVIITSFSCTETT